MIEPTELKGAGRQGILLFKDWSIYDPDIIKPQLPANIRYTPPIPNESLRMRIKPFENKLKDDKKTILKISLSFLERGTLEDDYGKDDSERDKFFTSHTIRIGDKDITLYQLSKESNKLSGNAISKVITAGQIIGEESLKLKSIELSKEVKNIMNGRGFFLVSDLWQVDDLALSIIEYILGQPI